MAVFRTIRFLFVCFSIVSCFECFHDQLPLDPVRTGLDGTREVTNEPIRIRPVFVEDQIDRTNLPSYVLADNGPLYDALDVLSRALFVKRVQNSFTIQPSVRCAGIGFCSDCSCQAPALQPIECGTYYTITEEDAILGTTGECTIFGTCEPFGPDNGGVADTDFVLYITANGTEGTGECHSNVAAFAYASACVIDENGQPLVGYLNLCPNNINTNVELKGDAVYDAPLFTSIFVHQILHTLGFSEKLFTDFERQPVTSLFGETYKNIPLTAIVTPKVVEMAREHYNCSNLAGVFVEETSSSHWEARILLPDVMANRIYPVYTVLSELTLALLSDSGWYEVNYTVAETTVQGYNIPLLYGKGLSCSFLRDDCRSTSSYPYYCGLEINTCSFEGIWKATCRANEYLSNDCRVPDPDPVLDCREDSAIPNELRLETSGPNSRCFRSSLTLISNPSPPGLGAVCYNVHPLIDGSTYYYGIETTADDVSQPSTSLFHFCTPTTERVDAAEELNLTGFVECANIELTEFFLTPENVTGEDQPEELCDSSCLTCVRVEDPTACLTCNGTGVTISGDPPGECTTLVQTEQTVRLRDGSSDERGRVEIFLSDEWRTICSDTWDINIAHVVCQQLGYLRAEEAYIGSTGGQFGSGSDSIIESIQCNGNEALIRDCSIDITSSGTCSHSQDAAVICTESCSGSRSISNGLYEITYSVEGDNIDFTISASTIGWVGLGFSANQFMPNSDVIIGGKTNNLTVVSDRYATARAMPPVDEQQDIEMTAITTENGVTTVRFRRQRDTGDSMDDLTLDVCRYFLYAWGGTFDTNNPSSLGRHSHREASPYQVCIPPATICKECGFGTYRSGTECTSECPLGEVADYSPKRCRKPENHETGYILNATRYEAAAFVDEETNTLGTGSYLFTINIMSSDGSPIDDSASFFVTISNNNFRDVAGSSSNILVIVTNDVVPAGTYTFSIRIMPFVFPTVPEFEVEAEVRILPQPRSCTEVICENGGQCETVVINTITTFNCICITGFNGIFCENNINDCDPNPCVTGMCMDMVNDYSCVCSGSNCDVDMNDCDTYEPCLNGGSCLNVVGGYSCVCPQNWSGQNCSDDVNECDTLFQCQNGGACNNFNGGYSCECPSGYTGQNCLEDVNECEVLQPCQNNATCINSFGDYSCQCANYFEDRNCSTAIPDPCDDQPCDNDCRGISCINGDCLNENNTFTCNCFPGYTGPMCEMALDECTPNPCLNGGICVSLMGNFSCLCDGFFTGRLCQTQIEMNPCDPNPCLNDGMCVSLIGNFSCICDAYFTGRLCQTQIKMNPCDPNPCLNDGLCISLIGNFSCICDAYFTGRLCQTQIEMNPCDPNPCLNGGICVSLIDNFSCLCDGYFTGGLCQIEMNPCDPNPCQNGGMCEGLGSVFFCHCTGDYTGPTCNLNINPCNGSQPCGENATVFQVDCPEEIDRYGMAWPGALFGEVIGLNCSENGNITGIATRVCNDQGQWQVPDVLGCVDTTLTDVIEMINAMLPPLNISSFISDVIVADINMATDLLLNVTSVNSSLLPTSLNITLNFLATISTYASQTDLLANNMYNSMDLLQITDNILNVNNYPEWNVLDMDEWSGGSPLLLMSVENIANALGVNAASDMDTMTLPNGDKGVMFQGDFLSVQASLKTSVADCPSPDGMNYVDIQYPTKDDLESIPQSFGDPSSLPKITIPGALLQERATNTCHTVPVVNVIFRNATQLLPRDFNDGRGFGNFEVESYVISSQVASNAQKSESLKNEPVLIEFRINSSRVPTSVRCVFWNFTTASPNSYKLDSALLGGWSEEGLITNKFEEYSVICKSQHLTSFAVLVDYSGVLEPCSLEAMIFSILTYIGCGISIICLIISILFFLSLRRDLYRNIVHFVHVNFALALLIALILFVGGVSQAGNIKDACIAVAVCLHYFLLSSFSWMLCEGIMLYMLLIKVFGVQKRKWLYLYSLIGWGLPIPIVVVSTAVRHDQYYSTATDCDGNDINLCWLPSENGLIWAFLGPAIAIIVVNCVFAIMAIRSVVKFKRQQKIKAMRQKKTEKLFWYALKSFVIILPLLGLTWLFGILAANPWNRGLSITFSCLFIIFNSLQGFSVFLFHVVRHEKNWDKLKRFWVTKCLKRTAENGSSFRRGGTVEDYFSSRRRTTLRETISMKPFDKSGSFIQKEWGSLVNQSIGEQNEKDSITEENSREKKQQSETIKKQEVQVKTTQSENGISGPLLDEETELPDVVIKNNSN